MNPDMDYMKTALHGVGNRLNELKNKAVQPDYQQNDLTAPDYIKNRPGGYTVKTEETVTATYESRPGDISCNEASAAGASLRNVLIADFSEDILNAVLNNTLSCTAGKSAEELNGMEWTQAGTFYYKQIAFESQYGQKIPTIVLATTAGEKFLGDAQYNVAGLYVFDHKLASQADYEAIVVTAVEWPRIKFEDIKIPEKYLPEQASDIVILDSFRGHSYEDLIPLVQSGKLPFIKGGLADSLYRLHFCSSQTIEFSYIYIEDQQTVINVQTSNPGSPSWTSSTYKSAGASAVIVKGTKSTAGQITLNKTYSELVTLARKNIPLFVKLEGSTQWFQLFHNDTAYGTLVFFGYDNRNGLAILRVRSDDSITYTNTPVLSPSTKTDDQTQEVGVDSDGMLWTKPADTSLGLTGATVGQIAKISAVDASGKPTAWEPVNMPSGSGGEVWEKVAETTLTEIVNEIRLNFDPCKAVYLEFQYGAVENDLGVIGIYPNPQTPIYTAEKRSCAVDTTTSAANKRGYIFCTIDRRKGTQWVATSQTFYRSEAPFGSIKPGEAMNCDIGIFNNNTWASVLWKPKLVGTDYINSVSAFGAGMNIGTTLTVWGIKV